MSSLESYKLTYNITSLPTILFAEMTNAAEPLTFDSTKFYVPKELNGQPVEVRICIYDPNGTLVQMASEVTPSAAPIVCNLAEVLGLRMVKELLDKISR